MNEALLGIVGTLIAALIWVLRHFAMHNKELVTVLTKQNQILGRISDGLHHLDDNDDKIIEGLEELQDGQQREAREPNG